MTPVLLGVIGLCLAHPVPAALSRMRWPLRVPRAAIVLWQSLAAAAILAVLGAGLSTALWLVEPGDPGPWRIAIHFAVLAVTAMISVRLAWAVVLVARNTRARRRRHRLLVDLLGEGDPQVEATAAGIAEPALRILGDETPVAYCLPARRNSRVVLSAGTLSRLDADELAAVLAHERAHVRARHDLVLEAFTALRHAFPRGAKGDAPLHQSQVLVELLADDVARREVGVRPLAQALVALAGQTTPPGAMGAGSAARVRLERLGDDSASRYVAEALAAYGIAAAVLVVPTVALAIPWMLSAVRVL